MSERLDVGGYLAGVEEMRRRELIWGFVRDAAAPNFGHQSIVTRTTVLLDAHARAHQLGVVCVSPIDVVLDKEKALVVQPDVVFVSNERTSIIRDQIWGAPDLVVEVTSRRTARRDRTTKLGWYRTYGVREYWLVDPGDCSVVVINLEATGRQATRYSHGDRPVHSIVLPLFQSTAAAFFG